MEQQQIIGPDVGKLFLDAHVPATARHLRVGNDRAGVASLVRSLGDGSGCLVVMEASGGYERLAHRELVALGVRAAIVNPIERAALDPPAEQPAPVGAGGRVRDFARAMGRDAKTDRVDAQGTAAYGAVKRPAPTPPPDPARAELGEILACRRQVVDEITTRRQQLEHFRSGTVRARMAKALLFLEQERQQLTRLLRDKVQEQPALEADYQLLLSMPGCGPVLAATLLAEMPELGALDRRKVASLAGLAPLARDGGLRENRRVIKGGRGQVRRALHMAAVASLRIKASPPKARYDRLTARGKPPKLALTALMRKMLVTLNAMLKTRQKWTDTREP